MNHDDLVPIWPGEFLRFIVLCERCRSREIGLAKGYYEPPNDY